MSMTNEEARQIAVERHDLREEIRALKGQVHALRRTLREVSMNIDISTINQSKRSQEKWAHLRMLAQEALAANPEPKL